MGHEEKKWLDTASARPSRVSIQGGLKITNVNLTDLYPAPGLDPMYRGGRSYEAIINGLSLPKGAMGDQSHLEAANTSSDQV